MADVTSSGQVAEMVKCSRPSHGASSVIRPHSPHSQRRAPVAGRDSVVWRQEGVVKEGCGGEGQKDEAVGGTPSKDLLRCDGVSFFKIAYKIKS